MVSATHHDHPASIGHRLLRRLEQFLISEVEDVVLRRELRPEPYKTRTRLEVVEADRERVEQFCRDNHTSLVDRIKMSSYLDNGYRGLFANLDGQLIGHVWYCDPRSGPANHPHLSRFELVLEPGDVWSFDLYIAPERRGGGIADDFFVLLRKHLAGLGYQRVYGVVSARNLPSMWLHKMQHYTPVKTVRSRMFLDHALLVSGGRMYLRNPLFGVKQKFDYRLVAALPRGART